MTTTISSKGQITVPVRLREALGLLAGTRLELELGPQGTIIARKAAPSFFSKFQGLGANAKVPYQDSVGAVEFLRGAVAKGDVD